MAQPLATERPDSALSFNTRQIVISGVLGGVAIFLGATRWGFIPVPNLTGSATIMHVPAILGGVLEGPIVGVLVGGIFGVYSWVDASIPLFKDPSVAVLPRLLIGLVAWAAFMGLRGWSVYVAAAVAGVLGSAANTIGVLGMGYLRGYLPWEAIPPILPQAVAEAVIAAIVTVAITQGVLIYRSGRTTAPDIRHGEEQRY